MRFVIPYQNKIHLEMMYRRVRRGTLFEMEENQKITVGTFIGKSVEVFVTATDSENYVLHNCST